MATFVDHLLAARRHEAPMILPRIDRHPAVRPMYAISQDQLNALLDEIERLREIR